MYTYRIAVGIEPAYNQLRKSELAIAILEIWSHELEYVVLKQF